MNKTTQGGTNGYSKLIDMLNEKIDDLKVDMKNGFDELKQLFASHNSENNVMFQTMKAIQDTTKAENDKKYASKWVEDDIIGIKKYIWKVVGAIAFAGILAVMALLDFSKYIKLP